MEVQLCFIASGHTANACDGFFENIRKNFSISATHHPLLNPVQITRLLHYRLAINLGKILSMVCIFTVAINLKISKQQVFSFYADEPRSVHNKTFTTDTTFSSFNLLKRYATC